MPRRFGRRLLALLVCVAFGAVASLGQLQPRVPFAKSLPGPPSGSAIDSVMVKFHEGTRIRFRDPDFVILERSPRDEDQLATRKLDDKQVETDLQTFQGILAASPLVVGVARTFDASEPVLELRRAAGENAAGRELADLDLYVRIEVPSGTTAGAVAGLIADLDDLASVEVAYAAAVPSLPTDLPPTTPDFTVLGFQGYLESASLGGIDARYAWTVPGGKGDGARVVDVEYTWRLAHEDFPAVSYQGGANTGNGTEHGDAVIGILAAPDNGYGVTGIAHHASIGLQSVLGVGLANAIHQAALNAGPGGIVLIEQQVGSTPPPGSTCPCPQGFSCIFSLVPVEYEPASFDAIHTATANGVIVVEAAANGSNNLDDPHYGGAFDRQVRDSGAILVAASTGAPRVPVCTTNFGSRVDLHGWGRTITTLGYGDLFGSGDPSQAYTALFGGTSGASPMVAGAAADLQGAALAHNLQALSPAAMRQLLRNTGTAQAADPRQIGPLPNLHAALDQLIGTTTDNPPNPRLSVTCAGLYCQANASGSTDDFPGMTFSFQWETGGAATPFSSVPNANHTYAVPGVIYPITVTVKDSAGQTRAASVSAWVAGTTPIDTVGLAPADPAAIELRLFHAAGLGQNLQVQISGATGVGVSGDWNGDGIDTVGRYDPVTSTFTLRNSNFSGAPDVTFSFAAGSILRTDPLIPIAGDWNGDGRDTCGLYDPATGWFYLRNANTTGDAEISFKINALLGTGSSVRPVAGDWNGDGIDSVGLFDATSGVFFLRNENSAGGPESIFNFGTPGGGLLPEAGDWDGDGWDSIGVWNPATGQHLLRNLNSAGVADHQFVFTLNQANTLPIAGDWDGDF